MSFSLQIRIKSSAETVRGGVSLWGLRLCPQRGSQHMKFWEQVSLCAHTPAGDIPLLLDRPDMYPGSQMFPLLFAQTSCSSSRSAPAFLLLAGLVISLC